MLEALFLAGVDTFRLNFMRAAARWSSVSPPAM